MQFGIFFRKSSIRATNETYYEWIIENNRDFNFKESPRMAYTLLQWFMFNY